MKQRFSLQAKNKPCLYHVHRSVLVFGSVNHDNWESHLICPGAHHMLHGLLAGLRQAPPKVFSQSILVFVFDQVFVQATPEGLMTNEVVKHADY
jgi:hypothetical protein